MNYPSRVEEVSNYNPKITYTTFVAVDKKDVTGWNGALGCFRLNEGFGILNLYEYLIDREYFWPNGCDIKILRGKFGGVATNGKDIAEYPDIVAAIDAEEFCGLLETISEILDIPVPNFGEHAHTRHALWELVKKYQPWGA
ncbi:hypothetical protein NSQ26_14065 [Bacillus sp. FSL W7-1360]